MTKNNTTLLGVSISKESAKAICLNCEVSWNGGKAHHRDLWFPRSVIEWMSEPQDGVVSVEVKTWFIAKLEEQNAFKGYEMHFNDIQNINI